MVNFFKIDFDQKRIFGLDLLRALAILSVVYIHGFEIIERIIPDSNNTIKNLFRVFGFDGVSVFFVLSGYLIGRILLKTIENQGVSFNVLLDFWMRRWLRTLPLYLLVLIAVQATHNFNISVRKYYFFLQNFNTSHPWFFPEAWSLAVEEWFYLLVPTFLFYDRTFEDKVSQGINYFMPCIDFRCHIFSFLQIYEH